MRKVLKDIDEVCHFWANQVQYEGQAGNVYFTDRVIYSYGPHFPIAKLLIRYGANGAADTLVAVFTTRTYSLSTGRHVSAAMRAARHLETIFVRDPDGTAHYQEFGTRNEISELIATANRCRSEANRLRHLSVAMKRAEHFNTFAMLRGETCRIDDSTLEKLREDIELSDSLNRVEEAKRNAKAIADLADDLAKWRKGETVYKNLYVAPPMLRLSQAAPDFTFGGLTEQVVETSHGANIPVADALNLWPIILRCRNGQREFTPGMPVGAYKLTKINRDGSIVVGCHNIAFEEIERIAEALGLKEAA